MILFRANSPAYIDRVDLWSGLNSIAQTAVNFDGDQSHGLKTGAAGLEPATPGFGGLRTKAAPLS
jgi:hypothetical protein